jgi:hypothetical protein
LKKTEHRNFCAVLGFWKKMVVLLLGIQKYWVFSLGKARSLEFQAFFRRMLVCGSIGGSGPLFSGFRAYCLTFLFKKKKTEHHNFRAVLGFWKKVVVGNSKVPGTFLRWQGWFPRISKNFRRMLVCGGIRSSGPLFSGFRAYCLTFFFGQKNGAT